MQNMYEDNRIVSDRTIDSHIKKLRKKIHQLSPDEELIHSVYGVGYRLLLNEKWMKKQINVNGKLYKN